MQGIPDLVDNAKHRLADVLQQALAQSQEARLDVVTAFFNLKGLEVLQPVLEKVAGLRLLLGKEQEQGFVVGERLLAELEHATARAETAAPELQRWQQFLAQDHVAVRRYAHSFLHGKAYIVQGVPTLGAMGIVGSSNFTGAGLTANRELNAVLKQSAAVRELQDWFQAHWEEAEDYKTELLALLERFTRVYSPYEIYMKVLYEALRDQLDQDLQEQEAKPSPIALADFQHDGYLAAKEILETYGGVLIADSVGLGKTYLALRLLDDYAYRERQTALIVCPAAVKQTVWQPRLQQFAIPCQLVSMEEISRQQFPVGDYARQFRIILVDESHNFRNSETNRWKNLFDLIRQDDPDKKVILLTATPVNNTVFDLYHQLQLITRGNQEFLHGVGIKDLWEYFRRAEANREALYEVLEALAVRRSRQFIRQNYPEAEIDGQKIRFPERNLHTVRYSLKETYGPNLYQKIASLIEELLLAPYQVEMYRKELIEARRRQPRQLRLFEDLDETEQSAAQRLQEALGWSKQQAQEFLMTVGRQTALAHIHRVLYLKRLESSVESLRISLRRLYRFLEAFQQALEAGRLLSSESFRQWLPQETSDDEDDTQEADFQTILPNLPELPKERYDVEKLQAAVRTDLQTLAGILQELEHDRTDTKLARLKELLASDELRGRKVVVFSYFKDTARSIYRRLRADPSIVGLWRMAIVDSEVKPEERTQQIQRFAPRANGRPDLPPDEQLNLLISTDVLSEGQNLQDADVIINYDLHWNPVRMVQRVGRLDRLGSDHERIYVYNFFPEEELEELLGLLQRLREKLEAINRTVGLDASILGETPHPMNFNILRRLEQEDPRALQELESESELAIGEFLKEDLLRFLKEIGEEKLKQIPLGVGTARRLAVGPWGFFAAFRNPQTNMHHWLFYDQQKKCVLDRRLEAIAPIRSAASEPAMALPEGFDPRPLIQKLRRHLWDRIRAALKAPARLPSAQRKIITRLRAQPPSANRNRLLQHLESCPLSGPTLRELQRLWRECSSLPPAEWMKRLADFVQNHPHPPTPPPQPQPSSAPEQEEDLECIAWMLVQP
ncbi:MAG TPA: helicase-related protein [Thermoguttaceae bacterium]|nr:helicase-related protein [Thermoguttaceae bacterium]